MSVTVAAALIASTATLVPLTVSGLALPGEAKINLIKSDLEFILAQIKISEANAPCEQLGSGVNQVGHPSLPFGIRTVDGSCNNLMPGQSEFGKADEIFPRALGVDLRTAESNPFGPPSPATSYTQTKGNVYDSEPRVISNLIADATAANPAASSVAAGTPDSGIVDLPLLFPGGDPYFIPNTAPDVGLSAPYNSWFTLFGQFFDHGLDLVTKGQSGLVRIPLKADDPLMVEFGPTFPPFLQVTRATNQSGAESFVGDDPGTAFDESLDDVHEHTNTTTPFVDQNQTYTSHPSHQVFLREYYDADSVGGLAPVATGALLDEPAANGGGLATWETTKAQARLMLGIRLLDSDIGNVPLVVTDPYGKVLRGPLGYAVLTFPDGTTGPVDGFADLVEANPNDNGGLGTLVGTAMRTGHAFLDDIAHAAVPTLVTVANLANFPGLAVGDLAVDSNVTSGLSTGVPSPAGSYDNELLDDHFITGDGRGNENIGLTTVHHVFHSEHNGVLEDIKTLIAANIGDTAFYNEWRDAVGEGGWNGERLFQAAKFVTEMEYQHLVFEEFARKVQPFLNVFSGYQTDVNPSIVAEFAHTVYRFGHSMLNESLDRVNADGSDNNLGLIEGFLNPNEFKDGGTAGPLTAEQAAGSLVTGMTRQVGNEIDEFVTEALRNNLVGLPLDLPTINIARGRDTGVPRLNAARQTFYDATGSSLLLPYTSWEDFGFGLKNPESLVNFIAAYGTDPSITGATTLAAKRAAANVLLANPTFMTAPAASSGVDNIDFWMGGLAEKGEPFGGLLGSTFNFVFETQLLKLQNGDRFYYLTRLAGTNLLSQLEENSFAALITRNSDATHLPADVFSTPGCTFELSVPGTLDDPEPCATTLMPDGTRRYTGDQHVLWGGTPGADKIRSSEGDDTIHGDAGNDRLEGGSGNDAIIGGDGHDIIQDTFGDDNIKGGDGNDAINSGSGFDLVLAGLGDDFVMAGQNLKETFGAGGDDVIYAGDDADTVFANEGDDWVQGGDGADLLQGDNGAPFQDGVVGDDVIIGDGGNDDYDSEGGNDIMVSGPGIERNEGMLGFDWVTHRGDPQAAVADMNFTGLLPPDIDNIKDRFDLVEGLSGWNFNDSLKGDNSNAATMAGHELVLSNADGIADIDGIEVLLGAGATGFTGGNILLGGDGSDLIEGRGGNDIIDGDRWLNVSLLDTGTLLKVTDMRVLTSLVFSGVIDLNNLEIVREIMDSVSDPSDVDTAVFSEPFANYTIARVPGADFFTVTHSTGTLTDGIDTIRNVEQLRFSDLTVDAPDPSNGLATGAPAISDTTPTEDQLLTASVGTIADPEGINLATLTYEWQVEPVLDSNVWETLSLGVSFTPTGEVGQRLRVVASFQDNAGVAEIVASAPTAPVANVNDPATGLPLISDQMPTQVGPQNASVDTLTSSVGAIADLDGMTTSVFSYAWQRGPGFATVGTNPTYAPVAADVGQVLRLQVTFTDDNGTVETRTSASTGVVGIYIKDSNVGNTLNGTAGEDFINGNGGADTINGLGANDRIDGGEGGDIINGGDADDRIEGGPGTDTINGNGGNDTINSLNATSGSGNDTIDGGAGNDVIHSFGSSGGIDAVVGGADNDTILARANNVLIGLSSVSGVETITSNGFTNVRITGNGGIDTLDFSLVTLVGIVSINGAGNNDVLTGSAIADTINGGLGLDTINGMGGDDTLNGDEGVDTINGGANNDTIDGGGGNDFVNGGTGNDAFNGMGGDDTLNGDEGVDTINGGANNDTIDGGGGNDFVNGGTGNDAFTVGGNDTLIFNALFGNDLIVSFDHNATGGQDLINLQGMGLNAGNLGTAWTITAIAGGVRVTVAGHGQIDLIGGGVTTGNVTVADFLFS